MANADRVLWLDVLSYLRKNHPDVCRQWFEDIVPAGTVDGVFRLRVDHPVHRRYLEKECAERFNDAVRAVSGHLLTVRFVAPGDEPVTQHVVAQSHNGHHAQEAPAIVIPLVRVGTTADASVERRPFKPGDYHHDSLVISPDFTFENFVIGPENRLAHSAAKAVAQNPGATYNPLFIHGGVGLGKSHLLQAICLHILSKQPGARILYVSCEGFTTQFMDAVQAGQMNEFRHRFRDVDVLVIDDIHFLAQREKTQEEFFHTFNSLLQAGKQIVLSSDAAPREIPDLEERLVSRFQSGMVAEVSQPGYETRVQIVRQKAKLRSFDVPGEVAEFIARRTQSNVRELEGAIIRLQHHAITDQRPIDLALAREVFGPSSGSVRPEVTITSIIEAVVDYYAVKLTDLQSIRRQKSIAFPRQVCMYLLRKHTRYSLEEIGGLFGGRDHTTVMHAVRTIEDRRTSDPTTAQAIELIERTFKPVEVA